MGLKYLHFDKNKFNENKTGFMKDFLIRTVFPSQLYGLKLLAPNIRREILILNYINKSFLQSED